MTDPADRHKPSTKHTLEDVLRGLQDLLHHELADSPRDPPKSPKPPRATRARREAVPGDPAPAEGRTRPLEQMSIPWDDVPELNEAVSPARAATGGEAARSPRECALRAVAKLNIELRKAGQPPLDAAIIERLARLLRAELETEAAPPREKAS